MNKTQTILTENSVGLIFSDKSGNLIEIFKICLTCCQGVIYYGCIENDPSDNYFAYNKQGQKLDHKGKVSKDTSLNLILE